MKNKFQATYSKDGLSAHKYRYKYPFGLNLDPNGEYHKQLLTAIKSFIQQGYNHVSQRFSDWDAISNTLTAYISSSEAENIKKTTVSSPLIVPISFASLQTLLTFMMSFFLREPVFRYTGTGGDSKDRIGALLLEMLVHQQVRREAMGLNFHTFFRDAYSYGYGVMVPSWITQSRIIRKEKDVMQQGLFGSYRVKRIEEVEEVTYEGNKLSNVDPYTFFFDPSVSISDIQDAEYFSYLERTNLTSLMKLDDPKLKRNDGLFNIKYLRHIDGKSKWYYEGGTVKQKKGDSLESFYSPTTPSTQDVIHTFIDLIPSEWGLDSSTEVETWLFSISGDEVIIDVRPINSEHGKKDIVTGSPDFDGYSATPTSRLEMIWPLQDTMDWLFTSHIANVKKAINDMLVVDPRMVYMTDLMNPTPGGLIRLKKSAWGQGVDKAIKQLNVTDVTGSHIKDTGVISEIVKQVSAASDVVSGKLRQGGERVSAEEAGNAWESSLGRLRKDAMIFSLQAFLPLGLMLGSNTVQYMSRTFKQRLTGEWERIYKEEAGVDNAVATFSKETIDINTDVTINDDLSMLSQGSAEALGNVYQSLLGNPEQAAKFDMVKIFMALARASGVNNVHEFIANKPVQTMSDVEIQKQVAAGNIVSAEEAING